MIHYYMILLHNCLLCLIAHIVPIEQYSETDSCAIQLWNSYAFHHFDVIYTIQTLLWSTLYDAWKCNLTYSFDNYKRYNL